MPRRLTIILLLHLMVVDSTTAETSTGTATTTTQTLLPTSPEISTPLSSSSISMTEASTTAKLGTHSVTSLACNVAVLLTALHLAVLQLMLLSSTFLLVGWFVRWFRL